MELLGSPRQFNATLHALREMQKQSELCDIEWQKKREALLQTKQIAKIAEKQELQGACTEQTKERMRLQKKLREIDKLEAREAPLQTNQIAKIAQKQELQDALAALRQSAIRIVVITPAGNELASVQMERSSTASDLLKLLAAKGLATLHRNRLVHKDRALKPNDKLNGEATDESLEVTLVKIATSYFATGTKEGEVSLWDVGRESGGQMVISGHGQAVTCVEFSPDGKTLLTASCDSTSKLWSVESHECLHTLQGLQAHIPICTAEFSPDGTHVVLSQRYGGVHGERPGVAVWRTEDGKHMRSLSVDGAMVGHGATWSPAGDLIATLGEGNGWVFCAQTGTALQCFCNADCMAAFFSPDGRFVCTIAGDYAFIRRASDMWTSTNETPILFQSLSHLAPGTSPTYSCQILRDDLVSLSSTGLCALAVGDFDDDDNGKGKGKNSGKGKDSGKGKGGKDDDDHKVSMVDLDKDPDTIWTFPVDSGVVGLEFEPHGSALMVLTEFGPPCLWKVTTGVCLRTFGEEPSSRVIWSPDGALAATFHNGGRISVWRIEDGACLHRFDEVGDVTCASFW